MSIPKRTALGGVGVLLGLYAAGCGGGVQQALYPQDDALKPAAVAVDDTAQREALSAVSLTGTWRGAFTAPISPGDSPYLGWRLQQQSTNVTITTAAYTLHGTFRNGTLKATGDGISLTGKVSGGGAAPLVLKGSLTPPGAGAYSYSATRGPRVPLDRTPPKLQRAVPASGSTVARTFNVTLYWSETMGSGHSITVEGTNLNAKVTRVAYYDNPPRFVWKVTAVPRDPEQAHGPLRLTINGPLGPTGYKDRFFNPARAYTLSYKVR